MAWTGSLAGMLAIWHSGEDCYFHALLLFDPQIHWVVVLLVNSYTFIPIDGAANITLTSLDAGVTRLLAGQASLRLRMLYFIIDGILVVLSALAVFPLLRLRRRSRRLEQHQWMRFKDIRLGLRLTWNIVLPFVLVLGVFSS